MNFTHRLAQVTLLAAVFAAGVTVVQPSQAAAKPLQIVELPRVTIVARRASVQVAAVRIIDLPRVVVVAKRETPELTVVAQR